MSIKHTPGPWQYFVTKRYNDIVAIAPSGTVIVKTGSLNDDDCNNIECCKTVEHANAKRIVECVNACEGLENPEIEILNLKGALEANRRELSEIRNLIKADENESTFDEVVRLHSRYGTAVLINNDLKRSTSKLNDAAPEMLEALTAAHAIFVTQGIGHEHPMCGEQYRLIAKAIKKATE